MNRSTETVDTLYTVETPEGALLQFTVAGPVIRGLAWLVDVTIRSALLYVLIIILSPTLFDKNSATAAVGLFLIVQFLISWFYTTLFEGLSGTTPGKRLFRLWVVHDNATPITMSAALVRNFLRAVDGLPFLNLLGVICMVIDSRFRRLGDLAAGTLVIYRNRPTETASLNHISSAPPPSWLSREERQAVVDFAERCEMLSESRQKELADILKPITGEDSDAVNTLKGWAQWIVTGQGDAQSTGV